MQDVGEKVKRRQIIASPMAGPKLIYRPTILSKVLKAKGLRAAVAISHRPQKAKREAFQLDGSIGAEKGRHKDLLHDFEAVLRQPDAASQPCKAPTCKGDLLPLPRTKDASHAASP